MEEPIIQQNESIKLIKNSKGYNWEIKLFLLESETSPIYETDNLSMTRLDLLNKQMEEKYGNTDNP